MATAAHDRVRLARDERGCLTEYCGVSHPLGSRFIRVGPSPVPESMARMTKLHSGHLPAAQRRMRRAV